MKKRSLRKVFGLVLILAGLIIFFLKPLVSLTGFAIAEKITENISSSLGLWVYALGLGLILCGTIILMAGREDFFMGSESKLREIVSHSGIDSPELEIIPDTCFIRELYHPEVKRVIADMTGRELVLLTNVLQEYSDNIKKGKFPNAPLRYLTGSQVKSRRVNAPNITPYIKQIREAWQDVCKNIPSAKTRETEINDILREGDSAILAYAIQRGKSPTLILSDDTHLRLIVPSLNKLYHTNIKVYSPREEAQAA